MVYPICFVFAAFVFVISLPPAAAVCLNSLTLDTRTHFLLDSCQTDDDDDDGGKQKTIGEKEKVKTALEKCQSISTIGKTVDGNQRLCQFGHWQSFTCPMGTGEVYSHVWRMIHALKFFCIFLQHSQNQIMESSQIYPIKNKKELRKVIPEKTNDIWAIGIIIRTKKI